MLFRSVARQNKNKINSALSKYWRVIQNTAGIENIALYSNNIVRTGRWGNAENGAINSNYVENINAIKAAVKTEQPVYYFECTSVCSLYLAYPVLIEGIVNGALVTTLRLSDVMLALSHATNTEIGIVVPTTSDHSLGKIVLKKWGYRVTSLTNSDRVSDLLLTMQAKNENIDSGGKSINYRVDESYVYRVDLIQLDDEIASPKLMVMSNVANKIQLIKDKVYYIVAVGLSGLVVSQLFVMLILWKPLKRISKAAMALPLLAHGRHNEVRDISLSGLGRNICRDETDVLDETTIELSYKLKRLHDNLESKNKELYIGIKNLEKQKDFISQLLNNAQMVVITMDSDLKVLSINKFGENITCMSANMFVGGLFTDNFPARSDFDSMMLELVEGKSDVVKNETVISLEDGVSKSIDWVHSLLPEMDGNDACILSVGSDVTSRKEVEKKLSWMADHDHLTGLFNRRRFNQELESVLTDAMRYQRKGAL